MNRIVYSIDKNGFIIDYYVGQFDDDGRLMTDFPNAVIETTPLPQPNFYKPKWKGTEWVEGATQEEIDEMTKVESLPPTDTEILGQQMTEREIEAMIQGQQLSDIEIRLLTLEVK